MSALIAEVGGGAKPSYFPFWGHRARREGELGKWCLSQWWPASFVVDGVEYATAEQYMMAGKARAFKDGDAERRIMATQDPAEAKKLGRSIKGFEERAWSEKRWHLVVTGNAGKFGQHPALASFLLSTGDAVLVEASPVDTVWGVGLAENSPDICSPGKWRGLNLLGFALMEVRARLRARAS